MPVSLTCSCGALLEIDDKFAGQIIHCPDCNRPLNTAPPAPEPPLTSGFALASLLLALVGAFTVVGTILAVVCGVTALKQIRRAPEQIGGTRFARAGIVLGAVLTPLTLVALWSPEVLRLDGLLRAIEWAGKIDYPARDMVAITPSAGLDLGQSSSIMRPSAAWGRSTFQKSDTPKETAHDLVLVNVWEDAYIICLTKWLDGQAQTLEECRQEGQEKFLQSEFVSKVLGRVPSDGPPLVGQDRERKQLPGTETQEFLFDIRLGGVDRTFLIRVLRDGNRLYVVAGGTRKNRFARLQPEIVKALDSFKMEK
jgi:hypothetical protein